MLTTEGRNQIKRYLAQYESAIAAGMVFGIGQRNETGADLNLQFETTKSAITTILYDFANDAITYKATVPENFTGQIYEVGLISAMDDVIDGSYSSKTISEMSSKEAWVDSVTGNAETFTFNGNSRIGFDSVTHVPTATLSKSSSLRSINLDLSGYVGQDFVTVAFNVNNTNTASGKVTFYTDANNYYQFDVGSAIQSVGYKIVDMFKSTASVVGTPSWSGITEIKLTTTSGVSGPSQIDWEGIRMNRNNINNLDYVLVARRVLATPVTKTPGVPLDIEFNLDASVS